MKHKSGSSDRRLNSPKREHEVIYVIAEGFADEGPSNKAWKRHARELLTVAYSGRNHKLVKRQPPPLIFDNKDMDMLIVPNHDVFLLLSIMNIPPNASGSKQNHGSLMGVE